MTEREAQEIIRMVEGHYSCDFGKEGRSLWARGLYGIDADLATHALATLTKRPLPGRRFKPQLSDLLEVIQGMVREQRRALEQTVTEEQGKRGTAAPEWVWVWSWTRFIRAPKIEDGFPQQRDHLGPEAVMLSTAQYESLRDEWRAAGKPKRSHPVPLVA